MAVKKKIKASVLGTYFLVIFLIGLVLFPFYEKGAIELKINQLHHPIWDAFFANITHLGDGLVLVIPLLLLFFSQVLLIDPFWFVFLNPPDPGPNW